MTYDWDEIRAQLEKDIEVFYVKDQKVNREREQNKSRTIDWIIERMKMGPHIGGTRGYAPDFTWGFGGLWPQVSKAVRMRYPRCQICGEHGTVEVHHIRPRFLRGAEVDPCNLMGLCVECHDEVHRRIDEKISEAIMDSVTWTPDDPPVTLDDFDVTE